MSSKLVRTNLHNHTNRSDGSDEPIASLFSLARHVQFGTISDHDTIAGWEHLVDRMSVLLPIKKGPGYFTMNSSGYSPSFNPVAIDGLVGQDEIVVYCGMEMTVAHPNKDGDLKSVHLVGLGIDPLTPPVQRHLARLTRYRYTRLEAMTNEINQRARGEYREDDRIVEPGIYEGVSIPYDGGNDSVRHIVGSSASPTKLHIAIALSRMFQRAGTRPSPRYCMKKYVSGLTAANFDHACLYPAQDGINVLQQQLCGVAILAHPQRTADDLGLRLETLVEQFASLGIQGLDANTAVDVDRLTPLANRHSLFITGGADTHGDHDEGWRTGPPYVEISLDNIYSLNAAIAKAKGLPRLEIVNEPHS